MPCSATLDFAFLKNVDALSAVEMSIPQSFGKGSGISSATQSTPSVARCASFASTSPSQAIFSCMSILPPQLFAFDARGRDDLLPFRNVVADEDGEAFRCHGCGVGALSGERLHDLGRLRCFADRSIEHRNRVARRSRR